MEEYFDNQFNTYVDLEQRLNEASRILANERLDERSMWRKISSFYDSDYLTDGFDYFRDKIVAKQLEPEVKNQYHLLCKIPIVPPLMDIYPGNHDYQKQNITLKNFYQNSEQYNPQPDNCHVCGRGISNYMPSYKKRYRFVVEPQNYCFRLLKEFYSLCDHCYGGAEIFRNQTNFARSYDSIGEYESYTRRLVAGLGDFDRYAYINEQIGGDWSIYDVSDEDWNKWHWDLFGLKVYSKFENRAEFDRWYRIEKLNWDG